MNDSDGRRVLRVVVADDELLARRRMVRLLDAIPHVDVVGVHETAGEVLAQVGTDDVDVLLLDIDMPELTGLQVHAMLGDDAPFVVFATAHPQHAVEAFELGAVDYVLKPIEAGRLSKAIARARQHRAASTGRLRVSRLEPLPIVTHDGIVLVDPREVSHAVFDGTLVTVVTRTGARHLCDISLQELLGRLPEDDFARVHRRAVVNLREIDVLRPTATGGFVAAMRGGDDVGVSRQSARRLRRWLGIVKP